MLKFKEIKEFYLLQKFIITLLVKTTTAGLQMVASSIKRLVVKVTRSAHASTKNFHFEDDIGVRPRTLIRPDTQLLNSIGYTVIMSDISACYTTLYLFRYPYICFDILNKYF